MATRSSIDPSGSLRSPLDRRTLAKAITLVESTRFDHRKQAQDLVRDAMATSRKNGHPVLRIGISGTPGVGKSTFIESFGLLLCKQGLRVAVLAVDPSSTRHGGSILGDKTRMAGLSVHPNAFIRPSPSGGNLGGVARRTRESMLICEAAGFDVIIVETVGVGQSEIAVANLTDVFLLLLAPAGGDELQGVKRGIMELADILVINKADGALLPVATSTLSDYASALRLLRPRSANWQPTSLLVSALTGFGVAEVWETLQRYRTTLSATGELSQRRSEQSHSWLWDELRDRVIETFRSNAEVRNALPEMEHQVRHADLPPGEAADELISIWLHGDDRNRSGSRGSNPQQ